MRRLNSLEAIFSKLDTINPRGLTVIVAASVCKQESYERNLNNAHIEGYISEVDRKA